MTDDKKVPQDGALEKRISGDAALLAAASTAVGLGAPVVSAWAQQHFQKPKDPPQGPPAEKE